MIAETYGKRTPSLQWCLDIMLAVYSSWLVVFALESRPPYAWSASGRYLYLWHPHAISLGRTDFLLYYLEVLALPALLILICLRIMDAFSSIRALLPIAGGAIAATGLPLMCLFVGSPLVALSVAELIVVSSCFLLWAYGKWPLSNSLSVFFLGLHFAFWFWIAVDASGRVVRPWLRWGIWDFLLIVFPILGFSYNLTLSSYLRRTANT